MKPHSFSSHFRTSVQAGYPSSFHWPTLPTLPVGTCHRAQPCPNPTDLNCSHLQTLDFLQDSASYRQEHNCLSINLCCKKRNGCKFFQGCLGSAGQQGWASIGEPCCPLVVRPCLTFAAKRPHIYGTAPLAISSLK